MSDTLSLATAREAIASGRVYLGIELGSTNIKAILIGPDLEPLASGTHTWENQFVDRLWTYSLDAVHEGVADAVAALLAESAEKYGVKPSKLAGVGVSAMMHGYLAFDANDHLLVPFRTWRNTNTGPAAAELTKALDFNMPLRWSASHLYQAILDGEPHVKDVAFLTTLAGYVHWQLTGERVLGVGDASGMFPIDPNTGTYDAAKLATFDELASSAIERNQQASGRAAKDVANNQQETRGVSAAPINLASLLPTALPAGADAGTLTEAGARFLDPTGTIQPGAVVCPPEGDAGTGMVATNAVAPRTGNVSVGTSIFAMLVLEHALKNVHEEIDIVTTPAGDPVAMIHCNNGASELGEWADLFGEFAKALDAPADQGAVFAALLNAALAGDPDGGGLLAYNYLAGETITGLDEGRPMVVRTPDSTLNLANFARTQVYSVFATMALGMRILAAEGVEVDELLAHGGLFRTPVVAQRLLAAAMNAPVALAATASEGGAWGIAVLAAYAAARHAGETRDLSTWLTEAVFPDLELIVEEPRPEDVAGMNAYLDHYQAGLPIQRAAVGSIQ